MCERLTRQDKGAIWMERHAVSSSPGHQINRGGHRWMACLTLRWIAHHSVLSSPCLSPPITQPGGPEGLVGEIHCCQVNSANEWTHTHTRTQNSDCQLKRGRGGVLCVFVHGCLWGVAQIDGHCLMVDNLSFATTPQKQLNSCLYIRGGLVA